MLKRHLNMSSYGVRYRVVLYNINVIQPFGVFEYFTNAVFLFF